MSNNFQKQFLILLACNEKAKDTSSVLVLFYRHGYQGGYFNLVDKWTYNLDLINRELDVITM